MRISINEHQYGPDTMVPNFSSDAAVNQESHPALGLWQRMRACIASIDNEIAARMREEYSVTMPQFELLTQLHGFPEGLRMGELSRLMQVSGASVTSITDQLEDAKLVIRTPSQVDRRVNSVKLTVVGARIFEKAAAAHDAWIIELVNGLSIRDNQGSCVKLSDKLDGVMYQSEEQSTRSIARSKGFARREGRAALA